MTYETFFINWVIFILTVLALPLSEATKTIWVSEWEPRKILYRNILYNVLNSQIKRWHINSSKNIK